MRFEGEEVPERRFSGTIVGVEDNPSSRWPDSKWRSLKVQWDEPSSIVRPDRVSPWEIEALVTSTPQILQPPQRNKRARPANLPPSISEFSALGTWKSPVDSPSSFPYCDTSRGTDLFPSPKLSSGSKVNNLAYSENGSLPPVSSRSMCCSNQPETDSTAPVSEKKQANGYRLFGIQLMDHSTVRDTSLTAPQPMVEDCPVLCLDSESDQHSEPSNPTRSEVPELSFEHEKSSLRSPNESHSKQIRSCTKVHMQGKAVGRAVDLTRFEGYEDLLRKFEEMFEIKGELCGSIKKWQVVYTDDEDDVMMVGDDPWHEFCNMVRKINIYTIEEAKMLSPKIKLPVNEVKSSKPVSDSSVGTEELV